MIDLRVLQTARFKKQAGRLQGAWKHQSDVEIRKIIAGPSIGTAKKGDLSGVRVHKFHLNNQLYLLAYTVAEKTLTLLMLGPHKNFYRNLKK